MRRKAMAIVVMHRVMGDDGVGLIGNGLFIFLYRFGVLLVLY